MQLGAACMLIGHSRDVDAGSVTGHSLLVLGQGSARPQGYVQTQS
jgi:hypothetical protein